MMHLMTSWLYLHWISMFRSTSLLDLLRFYLHPFDRTIYGIIKASKGGSRTTKIWFYTFIRSSQVLLAMTVPIYRPYIGGGTTSGPQQLRNGPEKWPVTPGPQPLQKRPSESARAGKSWRFAARAGGPAKSAGPARFKKPARPTNNFSKFLTLSQASSEISWISGPNLFIFVYKVWMAGMLGPNIYNNFSWNLFPIYKSQVSQVSGAAMLTGRSGRTDIRRLKVFSFLRQDEILKPDLWCCCSLR